MLFFDQYSRYRACAEILALTGADGSRSLLDVGGGEECLLGHFLSAPITYLDPRLARCVHRDSMHIAGDVFSSELNGRTFSYVTSIDTLQHVPASLRGAFVERLSCLAKDGMVLAFPSSDRGNALATDRAVADAYRQTYGREWSPLEDHFKYSLPELDAVLTQLRLLGWHCEVIKHGYAPWLRELLRFTTCASEVPEAHELVMHICGQFNRDLYEFHFSAPEYRQIIVATRAPIAALKAVIRHPMTVDAEERFDTLMSQAWHGLLPVLAKVSRARDEVLMQQSVTQSKLMEISDWAQSLQKRLESTEGLAAISHQSLTERDHQIEAMLSSWSWRITAPLRFILRLSRHGLVPSDRRKLTHGLVKAYQRLPLPLSVKRAVSWVYKKLESSHTVLRRQALTSLTFEVPADQPRPQGMDAPDYIVWGVIDWHFRHQRPQQLAQALAASGRRVFYVSSNLIDDARPGFHHEPLDDSSRLFQINLFAEGAPVIYTSAPGLETVCQLRASIGDMLAWANSRQLVSLVQHPFWYDVAVVLPNCRVVYDCMDHHEGFGNTADAVLTLELALMRDADLTITTSAWLDGIVAEHAPHRALIRNAGEFVHFSRKPAVTYVEPQRRKIIGYYGAIAEWFDTDLIETLAKRFPDCCLLLIGADTVNAKGQLAHLPNVVMIGEIPYAELPKYLHAFDVCLLPFKVMPLTLATNPVKVYEYLGAGKPVVTVDLPEMKQFGELVTAAKTTDEFLVAVNDALSEVDATAAKSQRQGFAKEQTWHHRAQALIANVESIELDPIVSVVVVTYNNIAFTRACLSSLGEHSDYAKLEIIVVDNASTDGSPAFLKEWVAAASNRRLILNDDNRGFAAANNQGLAVAAGDYLVMLNNDTYVTSGWVRTLFKHLKRDRSIGLIGPVTNNIGNEARIEIAYGDMTEMMQASSAYTRKHLGQVFQLRTLAFFCVMMPRSVFDRVGWLDEAFGRGFFEDDDYCRRIEKSGLRVVCAEDVFIHHHLSASFNKLKSEERQKLFEQNKAVYEAKWGAWIPHSYRSKESD